MRSFAHPMGEDSNFSMIENPAPPIPAPLNVVPPSQEPDYSLMPGESLDQSPENFSQRQYYSNAPVTCADGDLVMVTSGGSGEAYLKQPTVLSDTDLIAASVSNFKEACIDLWKEISKLQDGLNFFAQKAQEAQDSVTGLLSNMAAEVSSIYPQLASQNPLQAISQYSQDPNMVDILNKYQPSIDSAQTQITQTQNYGSRCQSIINQLAAELDSLCAAYDNWQVTVEKSYSNVPTSDEVLTGIVNERVVPQVLPGQPASADTSMMIAAQNLEDAELMLAQISPDAASMIGLTQSQALNIAAGSGGTVVDAAVNQSEPNYKLVAGIILAIFLMRR